MVFSRDVPRTRGRHSVRRKVYVVLVSVLPTICGWNIVISSRGADIHFPGQGYHHRFESADIHFHGQGHLYQFESADPTAMDRDISMSRRVKEGILIFSYGNTSIGDFSSKIALY